MRHGPQLLPRVQVCRHHPPIRRPSTRRPAWPHQRSQIHRIRCSTHRIPPTPQGRIRRPENSSLQLISRVPRRLLRSCIYFLRPLGQPDQVRHRVHSRVHHARLHIQCRRPPVRPSQRCRIDHRPLHRRCRKRPVIFHLSHQPPAEPLIVATPRRHPVHTEAHRQQRLNRRERLRRPRLLSRHIRLRHRPLRNREQRLPRQPVENIDHPRLVHHRDRRNISVPRKQQRLRGRVVVPEVVVHELKGPHLLARRRSQRHNRVRIVVVPHPRPTVIVHRGAACRHKHQVMLPIRRQRSPCIARAARMRPRSAHPLQRLPLPQLLSCPHIKR